MEMKVVNVKFPTMHVWVSVLPVDSGLHFNLPRRHGSHRNNSWVLSLQKGKTCRLQTSSGFAHAWYRRWHTCIGALEVRLVRISLLTFSFHSLCLIVSLPSLKLSFFHYADKFWQADLEAEDKSIYHLTAVSCSSPCVRADKSVSACVVITFITLAFILSPPHPRLYWSALSFF